MPGNIANASPNGVLPQALCTAFTEMRQYEVLQNDYHDGTIQRSQLAQASRRKYRLTERLAASALPALYAFLSARIGVPFIYYDPFDVASGAQPGSNYDATGANTQGQVVVVVRGNWSQVTDMCRSNVNLELEEVA